MNYIKRWTPAVLVIVLLFWVMNVKADPDRFWGGKLQAAPATYQEKDELVALREYLELEEVHYLLREAHPRSLIVYYGEESRTRRGWTCKRFNDAFPKAQLKSLSIVDLIDASRGKTDFGC